MLQDNQFHADYTTISTAELISNFHSIIRDAIEHFGAQTQENYSLQANIVVEQQRCQALERAAWIKSIHDKEYEEILYYHCWISAAYGDIVDQL